ncbi:MAG: hypothetical protein J6B13_03845 [Muribaculaceae bacterium]|nr:hypothetical protein [Muribaculaceae bacterium]
MRTILTIILAVMTFISASAYKYAYSFDNTPISEAIVRISKDNTDVNISFIYKELDNYRTSAKIATNDVYTALRQTIGLNPVSIINQAGHYYIEALQHGRFIYHGNVVDADNEPIVGASVMILSARDSTVVTYGISDSEGHFSIPCDKKNILAKFYCMGYKTAFVKQPPFAMGSVTLQHSPIQLSAVSVEAGNTSLASDKNIYIPTIRQKNAAQDATDLLRRMAIPQLVINPADNSVKDVFGNDVKVFINYQMSSSDELKGMKMTDVRRIEYLEFPTDPRFRGEPRVVNFIVQEYEYGGYTKATESFRTLNGIFNNTSFFSRFTYKKMTYDVYAESDNQDYHHTGSDNVAVYRLENNSEPLTVNRKESFKESDTRSNQVPVTFRSTYNSPRFTARNTLSFTHFSSPEQQTSGDLEVNIHPETNYAYTRSNPNRNNTVSYNSNFWGLIGSNASFDITPSFRHTHRNNTSSYESTLIQSPVLNHITENTYNWGLQATGRMVFAQKNQLSLFVGGGQNIFKLDYQGANNARDSYSNSYLASDVRYRYQTKKVSVTTFVGFSMEHNSMNGISTNDASPRIGVNFWLSLNKKSQLSGYLSYQTTTPDISMKANDIVQSNEYMYLTANPNLRNWRNLNSNLAYNWNHNNSFSLAAFAGYDRDFNRVATIYQLYNNGSALLRSYVNDGSFIHYYLGVSANYKLFNNSLQLYANLTQNAYDITGSYKDSCYPFRIQVQADYYWKSFNILASWGNPQRTLTENSNYIIRGRNFHMLSVGWGNGIWNVNLSAKNIFNKGWQSETWQKNSPLYSERQHFYNPTAHASVNLSVIYTIGYGKKIQRGNEVGGQDSAPSAIVR